MTGLKTDIGAIHFVGIGGIGMSGIAEVMHNLGYKVQGSDVAESANVLRLRGRGIPVTIGNTAEALGSAKVAVFSSAVQFFGSTERSRTWMAVHPLVAEANRRWSTGPGASYTGSQCWPPSVVSWTKPSSVPAQIVSFFNGDSAMAKMVS